MGRSRSTPGHLIHYVVSGSYFLKTDHREYEVQAGDLIYYYESEDVFWRGIGQPVSFYSIAVKGDDLLPPSLDSRVVRGGHDLEQKFSKALRLFEEEGSQSDQLKLSALVSDLYSTFEGKRDYTYERDQSLWSFLELEIRKRRWYRASMNDLCSVSGYSRSSIIRSCKEATGITPLVWLREMRMTSARVLLEYSMSTISEISSQLSYPRVNEFSREFSKVFGMSPSSYREKIESSVIKTTSVIDPS